MRFRLVLLALLAASGMANAADTPQNSPLSAILSRYGGQEKLFQAEILSKEGTRCGELGPCRDFRYYRKGPANARLEERFNVRTWTVKVIHADEAKEFYVGPWWNRAWFWATGRKDGPLDRIDILSTQYDAQQLVISFLRGAQSSGVSFEGKALTADGQSADSFSQVLSLSSTTVHFLFDSDTHLCLERTLTTSSGQQPDSIITYSDYRYVNGLPYPFRTQLLDRESRRIYEETLRIVQIGGPLNDKLFTERPNQPLWVFPLEALVVLIIISPIVIWSWRRR